MDFTVKSLRPTDQSQIVSNEPSVPKETYFFVPCSIFHHDTIFQQLHYIAHNVTIYIYLYIYISLLVRHPCPYPHLQLAVLAPFHQLPGPVPWPRPSKPRYGGNDPRLSVVLGDGRGVGWWSPGGGFQDGNVHQIMTRTGPYGYI